MRNSNEVISENRTHQTTLESIDQQLNIMIRDAPIEEYINKLSHNKLVIELKDHITLIDGTQLIKSYGIRKAAIIITLVAGAIVASIGSVTFLVVAKQFPKTFATFADVPISDNFSDGFGKFLGWTNVAIEAIFYTWTISGILPPFQPKPKRNETFITNTSFVRYYTAKIFSWLPSLGEIAMAIASALPLTLVSLLDQEKDNTKSFIKYGVVSSIALVTVLSNKFFLSLTHRQFKQIWVWLRSGDEITISNIDSNILEQAKMAFLTATVRSNEKLKHLSKQELNTFVVSLREKVKISTDLENQSTPDQRWVKLIGLMFEDLSFVPAKINKWAIVLVPLLAIFAALSWLGLIATVPHSVKEKLNAASAWQYILMILAAIPLLEIGLSLGGAFGLSLSKMGDGKRSFVENMSSRIARYIGYIPITIFGLFSFGTNATLTIQQFKSKPAVTWALLPSATLGIDLINIASGIELWNQILMVLSTILNADNALFFKHADFIKGFSDKAKETSAEEIVEIILAINPNLQEKLMHFIPCMKDKELREFIDELTKALKIKLAMVASPLEVKPDTNQEKTLSENETKTFSKINFSYFFSGAHSNHKESLRLGTAVEHPLSSPTL